MFFPGVNNTGSRWEHHPIRDNGAWYISNGWDCIYDMSETFAENEVLLPHEKIILDKYWNHGNRRIKILKEAANRCGYSELRIFKSRDAYGCKGYTAFSKLDTYNKESDDA